MPGKREAVEAAAESLPIPESDEPKLKNGTIDYGDKQYVHPDVQKILDGGSITYEVGGLVVNAEKPDNDA